VFRLATVAEANFEAVSNILSSLSSAGLTLSASSPSSDGAAILEKPVSDRGTLEDLSQSRNSDF
jgi:hypothetical protein